MLKHTGTLPLDQISTASDSAWRETDQEEVARLEKIIEDGDYGSTTLSMFAQVVCDEHGVGAQAQDGAALLANGKRMTQALKNKKQQREEILKKHGPPVDFDSGNVPAWCTQPLLIDIFEKGHLGCPRQTFDFCWFACLLACLKQFACLLARSLACSLALLVHFLIASVYTLA